MLGDAYCSPAMFRVVRRWACADVLSRPPVAVWLQLNAVTVTLIVLMAPMRYVHSGGYENSKAGEVREHVLVHFHYALLAIHTSSIIESMTAKGK